MGLRKWMPWWARIGIKIVLSRLPLSYSTWRRLGIFRHGEMQDAEHALKSFKAHYFRASKLRELPPGFSALELGPGDAISSGIVATAHGASRTYLVDSGSFALQDVTSYIPLVRMLEGRGMSVPPIGDCRDFQDLLRRYQISYLTDGTRSLSTIPNNSIDFIWSNVVLEHVPLLEFELLIAELHRIIKPHGLMSHSIDLRDHLGGGLNNLRFSEDTWESNFMTRSGFYTNRLRFPELMDCFRRNSFSVLELNKQEWDLPPIERSKLSPKFQKIEDKDLRVAEFEIILTPLENCSNHN